MKGFGKTGKTAIIAIYLLIIESMNVKTMSALEAKNQFGELLETAQREPVVVTKHNRQVGAMFSMSDVQSMVRGYLSEPILEEVEKGNISPTDALLKQARMNERLAQSRKEIASGQGIEMDDAYFETLRNHVRKIANSTTQ